MSQWEYCRVSEHEWQRDARGGAVTEALVSVAYYLTGQEVFKFAAPASSFGNLLGLLGQHDWELVSVQHSIVIAGTAYGGEIAALAERHPSGDATWKYRGVTRTAYLKRPRQAERRIDDAF